MTVTNRHVLVKPAFSLAEFQGLLIDWRDSDKGRELLVTYWREDEGRTFTEWLTVEQVRPAKTS